MQPYLRGWRDLLARPGGNHHSQASSDNNDGVPSRAGLADHRSHIRLRPSDLIEWIIWDQYFLAIDDPLRRAQAYCLALSDPYDPRRPRATEAIWRLEPLRSLIGQPAGSPGPTELLAFGALVHRIWYADPDFPAQKAFLRLNPQEPFLLRRDWIEDASPTQGNVIAEAFDAIRPTLLQALPAAHPDLVGSLAAATMIAASGEVRRDEAMLRAWFERMDIAPPEENGFFPQLLRQPLTSTDTAIVFRAWPMIPRASTAAALDFAYSTEICGTLGLLHRRQCRASADVLRPWLIHVAEIDDISPAVALGVVAAVAALFPRFSPDADQAWELSPIDWIADLDGTGPMWQAWLSRLDLFVLHQRPDLWSIVFIAVLAGASDTVERIVTKVGPPPRWDLGWLVGLEAALTSSNDHSGAMADRVRIGLAGPKGRRLVAAAICAARQSRDPIRSATARAVARRLRRPPQAASGNRSGPMDAGSV